MFLYYYSAFFLASSFSTTYLIPLQSISYINTLSRTFPARLGPIAKCIYHHEGHEEHEEMGGKKDKRFLQKRTWPLMFSALLGQGNRKIRALAPKGASCNGIQWLHCLFSSILFLRGLRRKKI